MNKLICVAAAMLALTTAPASSAVVAGSITGGTALAGATPGTFVQLSTGSPFSVGNDNFGTNNLYAFDEAQNFVLTAALAGDLGVTTIAPGTLVSSHFVVFDPLLRQTLQGGISFNGKVLSVISTRNNLIASNYLGAPAVTYLTPISVGLEPGEDFVTIGIPNGNSVRLNFLGADTPGDSFRVITEALAVGVVPEPSTWMMLVVGFAAIGRSLRRRAQPASRFA